MVRDINGSFNVTLTSVVLRFRRTSATRINAKIVLWGEYVIISQKMENYLSKTTYIKSVHSNVFNNLIPQPRYQYSCRTIQKHSWDYQYKEEAFMKYLLAQIWIWYEFRVNLNQISYIGCNIWTKASIQIDSPPEKDEQESSPNHNQGQYKKRINIGK